MNNYEINCNTLALIPLDGKTQVYEKDGKNFIINKDTYKIMENSCEYFGSSLEGRQKGTTSMIGITHKTPIIIEESKEIIFFPTASPRLKTCAWISLNNLESYNNLKHNVILKFNTNEEISVNVSYGIIDNQVLRATRLESALRKRKKS